MRHYCQKLGNRAKKEEIPCFKDPGSCSSKVCKVRTTYETYSRDEPTATEDLESRVRKEALQ